MKAPSELLMVSNNDRHPTERADLWGKRFVAAIETEQGRKLAEVFVKEATGGDPIRARRMREDFWEFQPTHKVFLATNHKPDHHRDRYRHLGAYQTRAVHGHHPRRRTGYDPAREARAGVAWHSQLGLQGCSAWQQEGLGEPDEVKHATAGYRSEMDVLGQFIDELLSRRAELSHESQRPCTTPTSAGVTNKAASTIPAPWGMSLTERGFERFTNNGTWYRGIGLREPIPPPTEPTEATEGRKKMVP